MLTHHLENLQKYALLLHIGFWSGEKRRIEIAESFGQPIVTISSSNPLAVSLDIALVA
jgi:hypothetical protein